jgi:hypothetical protein
VELIQESEDLRLRLKNVTVRLGTAAQFRLMRFYNSSRLINNNPISYEINVLKIQTQRNRMETTRFDNKIYRRSFGTVIYKAFWTSNLMGPFTSSHSVSVVLKCKRRRSRLNTCKLQAFRQRSKTDVHVPVVAGTMVAATRTSTYDYCFYGARHFSAPQHTRLYVHGHCEVDSVMDT